MPDWVVVDDPMFYKGLCERWQLECNFLQSKIDHQKARLEKVRQAFRDAETDEQLIADIHRIVFN